MSDKVLLKPSEERLFCAEDIPLLTAQVSLPYTENNNGRFNRYYRIFQQKFEQYCSKEVFPRAEAAYFRAKEEAGAIPQWRSEVKSTITLEKDGILSLFCDTIVTGTPQRQVRRQGDTWDMTRGLFLQLSDCFPARAPWKARLLEHAEKVIESEEKAGLSHYHDGWRSKLRSSFHAHRFYLSEEGLHFFFPFGSLAAGEISDFLLPFSEKNGPFLPNIFAKK